MRLIGKLRYDNTVVYVGPPNSAGRYTRVIKRDKAFVFVAQDIDAGESIVMEMLETMPGRGLMWEHRELNALEAVPLTANDSDGQQGRFQVAGGGGVRLSFNSEATAHKVAKNRSKHSNTTWNVYDMGSRGSRLAKRTGSPWRVLAQYYRGQWMQKHYYAKGSRISRRTGRDMESELRKLSLQSLGRLLRQAIRQGDDHKARLIEQEIDRRSRR